MLNLTYHEIDFHLPTVWTFPATSHGKGPMDGIGAAVKSRATRYLTSGTADHAFLSPYEFYHFVKSAIEHQSSTDDSKSHFPIEVFFLSKEDIEGRLHDLTESRWIDLPKKRWIEGTQCFHRFYPRAIAAIDFSLTSESKDIETFLLHEHLN